MLRASFIKKVKKMAFVEANLDKEKEELQGQKKGGAVRAPPYVLVYVKRDAAGDLVIGNVIVSEDRHVIRMHGLVV